VGDARLAGADGRLRVERALGVGTGFQAEFAGTTAGHRVETGFLNRSGLMTGNALVNHVFAPGGELTTLTPSLGVDWVEEADGDGNASVFVETEALIHRLHEVTFTGSADRYQEQGAEVDGWRARLDYQGEAGQALAFGGWGEVGRQLDYGRLVGAAATVVGASVIARPTPSLRVDASVERRTFAPLGASVEEALRLRNRVQWQFTRELGLRVVEEYTERVATGRRLVSTVLFTWLRSPGTGLWAGYAETTDLDESAGPAALDRTVFAKATVLFRP
jgi:hypothetical protein